MRILPGVLVRDPVIEDPEEEPEEDPDDDPQDQDPLPPLERVGIFASFLGTQNIKQFPFNLNFPSPEPSYTRQNVTAAPFVAPGSTQSFSVEIRPGDPKAAIDVQQAASNPKRRAELSWRISSLDEVPRFTPGQQGWFGAHFYLPGDPMAEVKGCSVFQLHNNPDPGVLWNLFCFGGRLRSANSQGGGIPETELMNIPLAPFLDRWNRLVVNFKVSTGGDGFIKMWINDVQLINKTGKNKVSGTRSAFLKNGCYFWGYENFDFVRRAKCFFDHIRLGNQTSDFESVNPGNPFT